jgi:RHS repeat-associated protein
LNYKVTKAKSVSYFAENRLVSYVGGVITASFLYDADGNRVQGTVNTVTIKYVRAHYEVEGSTVRKFYYAGGVRVAMRTGTGNPNYFLTDHLGSTTVTLTNTGTREAELRYSAWGMSRYTFGNTPTSFQYTGQRIELDIYFYGARYYDPRLGRFLSADSIIPGAGSALAWDRYAGMANNPVNFSDPSGHDPRPGYRGDYNEPTGALDMLDVAKEYGINFNGGSYSQKAAVILAAIAIGHKLQSTLEKATSASQAFSSVMGEVTATFSGSEKGCNASGGNGFVCGTSTWSDPRVYTHEFGHTFSQEYGRRPYNELGEAYSEDLDGNWIMGTHNGNYERTLRGYKGDGPPYMYHGPDYDIDWNSNTDNIARNEDYADMFMNWIYNSFDTAGGTFGAGNQRYAWMSVNVAETIGEH